MSDLVLLGAAGGGTLGELGALVGEAGVRAVGVVPQPGVLGVVVPASSRYQVAVLECVSSTRCCTPSCWRGWC